MHGLFSISCLYSSLVPKRGSTFVVVCGGIAVIGTAGHVVFQYRSKPEGCDAEVGEVVQVLFDAGKVTAVACIGVIAVYLVLGHARNLVIVRICHWQSGRASAGTVRRRRRNLYVRNLSCCVPSVHIPLRVSFSFSEGEVEFAGFYILVQFQIDQEVVVAFQLDGAAQ